MQNMGALRSEEVRLACRRFGFSDALANFTTSGAVLPNMIDIIALFSCLRI